MHHGVEFDRNVVEDAKGAPPEAPPDGTFCLMAERMPHTPQPAERDYVELIRTFHLPRFAEIPPIALYMDQVLAYVEACLRPLVATDEKLLTSSMVNNYVKQGMVPVPQAKRYTARHIAHLIVICLMKRSFSMPDIRTMLDTQNATHAPDRAYDFFCTAIEESLRALFCGELQTRRISSWDLVEPEGFAFSLRVADADTLTPERRLAIAAATCAANKIYVEKCFELGILDGQGAAKRAGARDARRRPARDARKGGANGSDR